MQRLAVRNSAMFAGWPEEEIAHVVESSTVVAMNDGELLHVRGEACRYLFLVVSGCIRLFSVGKDGREFTTWLHFAGDPHAIGPAVLRSTYQNNARARGETKLVRIEGALIREVIARNGRLAFDVMAALDKHRTATALLYERAATHSLEERIAGLLGLIVARQGRDRSLIELSQDEIAIMLGTRRQVVNRTLRQLQERRLIEVGYRGVVVIDAAGLAALLPSTTAVAMDPASPRV